MHVPGVCVTCCDKLPAPFCRAQSVAVPQELAAQIANASAHCARVIESKQATVAAVRALLARRDDQFVRLLRKQAEETDGLIASMHGQSEALKAVQERELEPVEAAYMQVRDPSICIGWAVAGACTVAKALQQKHYGGAVRGACCTSCPATTCASSPCGTHSLPPILRTEASCLLSKNPSSRCCWRSAAPPRPTSWSSTCRHASRLAAHSKRAGPGSSAAAREGRAPGQCIGPCMPARGPDAAQSQWC